MAAAAAPPGPPGQKDHQEGLEILDRPEHLEHLERTLSEGLFWQELQDLWDHLDQWDRRDQVEHLDSLDKWDHPDRKDHLAQLECLDLQETLVHQEWPVRLVQLVIVEFVRNTAPLTVECSSKTEHVVVVDKIVVMHRLVRLPSNPVDMVIVVKLPINAIC
ncbi:hypothetical protein TELCIR_16983 [Teladorsagia circumcincta]|uniref:Uncharacterized protein n=1 Tax=Teladorsagia circumcincta TaxID=45464 RepID=A0A2G9TU05_TELCI|nr:hypothetical protein TELCIR_16983 [Teladorsagia circumcincta]